MAVVADLKPDGEKKPPHNYIHIYLFIFSPKKNLVDFMVS